MHEDYLGNSWSACIAMAVIIVAVFLFAHSQDCLMSVASVLLLLPF